MSEPGNFSEVKAAQRTFLAWVRTGISMIGLGFVVAKFNLFLRMVQSTGNLMSMKPMEFSRWIGFALVGLGVGLVLMAGFLLREDIEAIRSGVFRRKTPLAEYLLVLAIALIGVLLLISLLP